MATPAARQHLFWAATQRLSLGLLLVWLVVNLAVPWFARDLHALQVFGFPLGFWLAAQGALLVYLAIVVLYVVAMNRLEALYAEATDAAPQTAPGSGPEPVATVPRT